MSNKRMTIASLFYTILLLMITSCNTLFGEDTYIDEGIALLQESDRNFSPYNVGDTLTLASPKSSITTVVESVFDTLIEDQTGGGPQSRTPKNIYFQDIEKRYITFRQDDSIQIIINPEKSLPGELYRGTVFFRSTEFRLDYTPQLLFFEGTYIDSVYSISGSYPNDDDRLWYSSELGIIKVQYQGILFKNLDLIDSRE